MSDIDKGEFFAPRTAGWAKDQTSTYRCPAGHTRIGVDLERCMASVGFDLCLQPLEEVKPDGV